MQQKERKNICFNFSWQDDFFEQAIIIIFVAFI